MQIWQVAAVAAGALLLLSVIVRLVGRRWPSRALEIIRATSQEAGTILGLFTLWQVVRILGVTRVEGGIERADDIWRLEQWLHFPSELSLEKFVLHHETVMRWANTFYAWVHFPAMNVFLIWLFVRHRDRYPPVRTTIVLLTGSCLVIHVFVPVAPPRMLTSVGFVDEAVLLGQSVYGEFGSGVAAQLSAMPSVHVGWAFLIAYEVIRISPSRWRWAILVHPVVTTLVVVVTANHFWADGIVAVALLVVADLLSRVPVRRLLAARTRREPVAAVSPSRPAPCADDVPPPSLVPNGLDTGPF